MTDPDRTPTLILLLASTVALLLLAVIGLFWRVQQVQEEVLTALAETRAATAPAGLAGESSALEAGTRAPDFTLSGLDGRPRSLSDYQGGKVLLGFFSTSCPGCQQTSPHLRTFQSRHPDLQVVLISQGSIDDNRRFARQHGFDFPVLPLLEGATVGLDYRVPGVPYFYFIAGGVVQRSSYAHTVDQLESLVGPGLG